MPKTAKPITILIAEDDPDDRLLTLETLAEHHLRNDVRFVEDGAALLDYLYQRNQFAANAPRPGLILLDLNMPKVDGRTALQTIKADPTLRQIPVVILTTSNTKEDVAAMYDLGASSFITKPVTFDGLAYVVKVLGKYWFNIVELPAAHMGD